MGCILLESTVLDRRAARLAVAPDRASPGQVLDLRVALAGGGANAGEIRLGRVRRIDQGLQAAFVDIGEDRDGYLDAADVRPRARRPLQRRLQEGQAVLVQVTKAAAGAKGAGLAMAVQLPGRFLVLTPTDGELTVSRRIADAATRQRLRAALADRFEAGCILRTGAEVAEAAELQAEYAALSALWAGMAHAPACPPQLLHGDDLLVAALRDWLRPGDTVLALDADAAALVRPWLQRFAPEVPLRLAGAADADAAALLEEAVQQALEPRLELPSGAVLSIVETPALTAIDVDSARAGGPAGRAGLRLNLEAAAEIARQLRLRGLGGLVVIDFLRLSGPDRAGQEGEVLAALRGALADDPDAGQVLPFSDLGLVELVRRRRGPSLAQALLAAGGEPPQAPPLSPQAAAALALRRLRTEQGAGQGRALHLACAPEVAALLPPAVLRAARLNATVGTDPSVPRHAPRIALARPDQGAQGC